MPSTVDSPLALYSAKTWVGISSYSFFICSSAQNTIVGFGYSEKSETYHRLRFIF